jgi:hypothetical protein
MYFAVHTVLTHSAYTIIHTILTLPVVCQTLFEDIFHFFPADEIVPHYPMVMSVNTTLFLGFFTESLVHCKQNTRVFATGAVGVYVYGRGHMGDVKFESEWIVFTDRVVGGMEVYGHRNNLI